MPPTATELPYDVATVALESGTTSSMDFASTAVPETVSVDAIDAVAAMYTPDEAWGVNEALETATKDGASKVYASENDLLREEVGDLQEKVRILKSQMTHFVSSLGEEVRILRSSFDEDRLRAREEVSILRAEIADLASSKEEEVCALQDRLAHVESSRAPASGGVGESSSSAVMGAEAPRSMVTPTEVGSRVCHDEVTSSVTPPPTLLENTKGASTAWSRLSNRRRSAPAPALSTTLSKKRGSVANIALDGSLLKELNNNKRSRRCSQRHSGRSHISPLSAGVEAPPDTPAEDHDDEEDDSLTHAKQLDLNWNTEFQKLLAYKKEHGDTNVPHGWKGDFKFNKWMRTQRGRFKMNTLSLDRMMRLSEAGFLWEGHYKKKQEERWDAHYQDFIAYKETHGADSLTYSSNRVLHLWVRRQKDMLRNETISLKRVQLLADAGIVLSPS